jgi:hypothetical protein
MLLEYRKPNVLTLPLTASNGAPEGSIKLVPGINDVTAQNWKRVSGLPAVKRLLESSELFVALDKEDTENSFALSAADVRDAVVIVKKTWDLVLLEEWRAGETRPGVVKEINKQITLIEEKTKPTKKAANG